MLTDAVRKQSATIHQQLNQNANNLGGLRYERDFSGHPKTPADTHVEQILKDGYIIIKDVLSQQDIKDIKDALDPLLSHTGRNRFEGEKTQRVYGVLGKTRTLDRVAEHPTITNILDRLLLPNCLITAGQAIKILPGEERQPWHYDDSFCRVPRPRRHFSVATIWAIDDFTADNGATVLYPRSHLWGQDEDPGTTRETFIPSVMPAGSVLVFLSTVWHGGGANTSTADRLAVTFQYCEPWIRPQENQFLAVPHDVVHKVSPKMQSLLGYSIHPPFIGMVDGQHPLKAIASKM
eukprot:GFYU01012403.1.p1 GENE.GFYU01012403.1~~GFYU01012403.1.p1  ORF type:complete len:299 (+),score=64.34 GFYU01012403.1:24-899(+)